MPSALDRVAWDARDDNIKPMSADSAPSTGNRPAVSIVIPTCNRREILQACLESLAKQDHDSFEIIVVDDCSTDDTPEFLQRFVTENPACDVKFLRNNKHAGANPSRNRGVQKSQGEFVAFVDSDCIANADWLVKLMRGFTSDRVAAVVGGVDSPAPRNIFELTLRGTQRVPGPGPANRLVGCNMCVRRDLLLRYTMDEDRSTVAKHLDGTVDVTVSGRGDEEGLYLMLRADGYEQRAVPDAIVLHEHYYTARSFVKQAFRSGRSAARLVYKFYLPPRLDLLPFMLTYVTLPLSFWNRLWLILPAFFLTGAVGAIAYNDLFRKRKTIIETALSFPTLLIYYHLRLTGYVLEAVRLRLGQHNIQRHRLRKQ